MKDMGSTNEAQPEALQVLLEQLSAAASQQVRLPPVFASSTHSGSANA